MHSTPSHERVVLDFLVEYMADKAAGEVRALSHYLQRFGGHEVAVASQYLALQAPTVHEPQRGSSRSAFSSMQSSGRLRASGLAGGTAVGRYEIRREIGRGGQGVVYLADDLQLKRQVALKVLDVDAARADDLLLRFRREAEVTSRLDHPGICTVYEAGNASGLAFIAMRYLPGETWARRIADRKDRSDRASLHEVLSLVEGVARALHAAHEAGIIHRDVKPANVIFAPDGTPVLLDFGLARDEMAKAPSLTGEGGLFGTPPFMSPEQFSGKVRPLDRRTDVYSLGVGLFQDLTGRLPFDAATVQALGTSVLTEPLPDARRSNRNISRDLAVVIGTALERDVERRYRTAHDFAEDLRCVRESRPVAARPASPWLSLRRWAARNPTLAVGAFLLTVVAAISLFFLAEQTRLTDKVQAQVHRLLQLADVRRARSLLDRTNQDLWPVEPSLVERCVAWRKDLEPVMARRSGHVEALQELEAGHGPVEGASSTERAWMIQLLGDLMDLYRQLDAELPRLAVREDLARTLEQRTLLDAADAWGRCRSAVKGAPAYAGLAFEPQLGLVPLGVDAESGFYEFWHVTSGDRPVFDSRRDRWQLEESSGVVFVLLPGGTFLMGSDRDSRDDRVLDNERGRHPVTLAPFMVSKYELTQAQWMRLAGGTNPAVHQQDNPPEGSRTAFETLLRTNPVENVTWTECFRVLAHYGMDLPTEAQWEYLCGGDSDGDWCSGSDERSLFSHANLLGSECARFGKDVSSFTDKRVWTAPAGSYRANTFGLYDVHGNVWEWCRDLFVRSYDEATPSAGDGLRDAPTRGGRVLRGGSIFAPPKHARTRQRNHALADDRRSDVGVRPVWKLRVLK